MRGKKPTSPELTLLRGNPGGHPLRNNPKPRILSQLPEPPAHLGPEGLECWRVTGGTLIDLGALSSLDLTTFELLCSCYGEWRLQTRRLQALPPDDPDHRLIARTVRQLGGDLLRISQEFGLTPTSRNRIHIDPSAGQPRRFGDLIRQA